MADDQQKNWEKQAGLSTETTSARIYPSRQQKQKWEEEAGSQSLSSYIIEHVEEARVRKKQEPSEAGSTSSNDTGQKQELQKLRQENQKLKQKLEQENSVEIQEDQIQKLLKDNPQKLDELLLKAVQTGILNQVIKTQIEEKLYKLAENGKAEYSRNPTGWKSSQNNN